MVQLKYTFILLLLFTGINATSILFSEENVTLKEVNSAFEKYEGSDYDFISSDVKYRKVGNGKYDEVFYRSAVINATVSQVDMTLKAINEETITLTDEYTIELIAFAVSDLPDLKDEAGTILEKIGAFNPKKDFKGLKGARKIPEVTKGLSLSKNQLNESIDQLPNLIEEVTRLAEEMASQE